jgi:hypothetical protein
MKKGEFDFVWLFAILAGAAILVLAIYGATKATDSMKYQQETQLTKSLAVILGPLQSGYADSKTNKISFGQETRIDNYCNDEGFGSNVLSTRTKSSIGNTWTTQTGEIAVNNLFIFSSSQQGKKFDILSKPFNYPFKVGEILIINSEKLCVKKMPIELEQDLENLAMASLEIVNCSEESKTICFGNSGCDINVYGTCSTMDCDSKYDEGYVEKNGERIYFVGNLLYAAIFSDKDLYDCNVQRLLYRASQLSQILSEKASLMDSRGCSTSLKADLSFWASTLNKSSVSSLDDNNKIARGLQKQASTERCKLW